MWRLVTVALATMLGVTGAFGADEPKFSAAQLEEMVAPIALYPDELLTQVCIAATYPLEVVEAQRWVGKNPALKGDELDKALAQEDWDDSVKWLTHFPDVLKRMSENLQWTQDLGNAFLEQQAEVMDAAQRMRAKAAAAGTLKTTPQQTVIKEKEVIRIVPADPQVVYVPTYAPATVYGPSYMPPPTPYYPSFWATPGGAVTAGVIGFGVGIGTAALFSSAFDWNDHNVYVHGNGWGGGGNVNVNKNVNINNQNFNNQSLKANGKKWEHNAEHRRGVGYRDQKTAQKYGGRDRANAQNRAARDQARGREGAGAGAGGDRLAGAQRPSGGGRPEGGGRPGGGADRPGGGANRPGAGQRPGGGGGAAAKPVAKPAARPATRPASGGSRDAFADRGGGNAARQASARGAASRGSVSRAGGGGFGGGGGQGGGGFGGGGGHGGGRGGGGGHRGGGGGGGGRRR